MSSFKQTHKLAVIMLLAIISGIKPAYAVNEKSLEEFGDIAQFAIPAIGWVGCNMAL
jgi:hypothetical protein